MTDTNDLTPVKALHAAIDTVYQFDAVDDVSLLRARLDDAERLIQPVTMIRGADALCARARFHMLVFQAAESRGENGSALARAVSLLKQAAFIEPHSADIHARLAEAALARAYAVGRLLQVQMTILCHSAAKRALELDQDSSVANAALGLLALFTPSAFGGSLYLARVHLERATRRDPRPDEWAPRLARAFIQLADTRQV